MTSQLWITALLLLIGIGNSYALSVTAQVDTHKIEEGDSLMLTVTVNERAFGKEPDFKPLEEQFRIINKVSSSSVRMINGSMESSLSWRLTLSPRVTGYIVIPPIKYGNASTKPITVQVAKRSASNKRSAKDLVFIEASVDKKSVYVQEQIILTLRLYKRTQLIDASWTPPQINDAASEPLTESRTYQTSIGGYTYQVTESTFAVFPQKSGTLVIPESQLIATIGTGRRGGFFDPFSSAGKQIRRTTKRFDIDVKPIPDSYPNTHWLPSSQVAIADQWAPANPTFKVGEAVTRTIILQAKGLSPTALPSIPAPSSDKFKVYPDKAETQNGIDADGILSQRIESYAFIPTEAGTLTLPEIQVSWWDVKNDQLQTATLPAQTIEVAGASTAQRTDQSVSAPPSISAAPSIAPPSVAIGDTNAASSQLWQWIAIACAGLWLLTFAALIWALSKKKKTPQNQPQDSGLTPPDIKQAKKALKQACQESSPRAVKTALVEWGKAMYPEQPCFSIGDVRGLVESERCKAEIKALEILLYKGEQQPSSGWDGIHLWEAIEEVEKQANVKQQAPALEPLYPTA